MQSSSDSGEGDSVGALWEHMFVSSIRDRVAVLLEEGLTPAQIARELRVAGPTVDYHIARLREARTDARATRARSASNARTHVTTRRAVAALLGQGVSRSDIAKRLGVSKATISYHARRLGAPVDSRCARRYDWTEIQRYYDEGHSVTECQKRFGFARASWSEARRRGAIVARPVKTADRGLPGRRPAHESAPSENTAP